MIQYIGIHIKEGKYEKDDRFVQGGEELAFCISTPHAHM